MKCHGGGFWLHLIGTGAGGATHNSAVQMGIATPLRSGRTEIWQSTGAETSGGTSSSGVLHSCRHTFGTRLGETGADAFTIMKLMGENAVARMEAYNRAEVHGVGTNLGTADIAKMAVKSQVV